MAGKEKIKSHTDAVYYFKELSFYNNNIEKPKIKRLKNIDLLSELPFYQKLNVKKQTLVKRGNWICFSLFQFHNKNSDKS